MLERQERVAILLLVGVAITVILAHTLLAGLGKQPFARPFTSNSPDGELVVVEGRIDQLAPTNSGGHSILTINNLTIFLPSDVVQAASLQKGDRVSLYGIVQTYRGKKEIIVNDPQDIRIIRSQSP